MAIERAAGFLDPNDRGPFLHRVAELLNGHEIGDGLVSRAAREAQAEFRWATYTRALAPQVTLVPASHCRINLHLMERLAMAALAAAAAENAALGHDAAVTAAGLRRLGVEGAKCVHDIVECDGPASFRSAAQCRYGLHCASIKMPMTPRSPVSRSALGRDH